MGIGRSAYGIDFLVTKDREGNVFIDKREDSLFDILTINENSNDPPPDDSELFGCNSAESLHKETTTANFNFSKQILLKNEVVTLSKPNPFQQSSDRVESVGYLYRSFDLGDGVKVVVRSEVDAYEPGEKDQNFIVIKSLNEYDHKITGGWRMKLESQKAGCFATELKNNNYKLTKWMLQAHLAGASKIKLGWLSRVNVKDSHTHAILGVSDHSPQELAQELGLDLTQVWGALKHLIQIFQEKFEEGSYIILRDPSRKSIHIYAVPEDEFRREIPTIKKPK